MSQAHRVQLTGRAFRFVRLLQDYGHLDEVAADRLFVAGWGGHEPGTTERVDIDGIRRAAAMVLFDPVELDPLLQEDWPLLFS